MENKIDLQGLINDENFDVDKIFTNWRTTGQPLASYGPGEVQVLLQSAEAYGITIYRWIERINSGESDHGDVYIDPSTAIAEYAAVVMLAAIRDSEEENNNDE